MQLIRGLHNLTRFRAQFSEGCVLTIGNFDGIHLGHSRVLQEVSKKARQLRLPSVVMVFEPLPIEYFAPDKAPVRLMNLREKLQAFNSTHIDYVLCVHFNEQFANLTAEAFVEQILVDAFAVKHLVVGDDFRFGKERRGNFTFLQETGKTFGFTVTDMPTYCIDNERVSSTRIRTELEKPDLAGVERLMGAPFGFSGRVIHGQKLGRTIGFPTLNLNPKRMQMPVQGVFAVEVDGIADTSWPGVANIGLRPTVDGIRPSIEVHLFDWQQDLYGRHIVVKLRHFIRPEMKFDGIEQLRVQIEKDAAQARQFFEEYYLNAQQIDVLESNA
ncbi:bifunctional riboflavin kinase/FAD synthetase [Thiomicrorhabdus xiamenensis]|uniref:Riboflavin biosynthesis protein n=1 Tax=Thiomicrorhabdus xiamenensis TaxID=2739063 RepID=A0A7D4TDE0_9GAMM|nr:bifunctional riboflavin kinase/FAD synthetase [Thiomicrorhabdus xiamenensis]QKI88567.1 bifunctional riboflavin kinase/FAD synthetase [Thiomicrorhabdus xiamenensis]